MRVTHQTQRPELEREDAPATELRDAIDRLIGYLSRSAWHKRPELIDMRRIDDLLDDIEAKRDAATAHKTAIKKARDRERGLA